MAETMQELLIRISARIDDLSTKMDAAKGEISGISEHTKSKSKEMSSSWLDTAKAIAFWETIVEGGKEVIKQWVDEAVKFDAQMGALKVSTGASKEEMAAYSEVARTAGINLGYAASETASAMSYMAKEGITAANSIGVVLTPALNLARAAGIDTATSSKLVTDTLKNFSLSLNDAGKVSDIFANFLTKTNGSAEDLNAIITKAGPAARAYGQDISSLTALFMAFDGVNVDASRASQVYTLAMNQLTKAFDESGNAATKGGKILLDHGVTAQRLAELMHDPVNMMLEFSKLNLSTADAMQIFGTRGGQVFSNLLNSSQLLVEAQKNIGGTGDAAKIAAERMGEWENMINRGKAALAAMGNVLAKDIMGALTSVGNALKWVSDHLGKMVEGVEKSSNALFGVFAPLKQLADHWVKASVESKKAQETMTADGGKLQEVFKGVATTAADMGDIFQNDDEKLKIAAEKMAETMRAFHQKLYEMSDKTAQDRRADIQAEIDGWRKKGVDQANLAKLRTEMVKKYEKEMTDDAYAKLKQSDSFLKASHIERLAMLKSWRENSINNNEALKVSTGDLAEYQKAAAADVAKVYEDVFMGPMDEGFKQLFAGIKEGHMDVAAAAETAAKAMGKAILESLAKQADANVAATIASAAAQGGIWGLAANAGAIALATAEALAIHAIAASFANGGIVGSPMLAMIGDRPQGPEVVMGLDQLSDMLKPRTTDSGSQNAQSDNGMGGGETSVVFNFNHNPTFSTASPAEARRMGMEVSRVLQEFGFRSAKA